MGVLSNVRKSYEDYKVKKEKQRKRNIERMEVEANLLEKEARQKERIFKAQERMKRYRSSGGLGDALLGFASNVSKNAQTDWIGDFKINLQSDFGFTEPKRRKRKR